MEDNYNGQLIYSESLDRKSLNGIKGFLLIVGLVFGCLLLILLVGFIQYNKVRHRSDTLAQGCVDKKYSFK